MFGSKFAYPPRRELELLERLLDERLLLERLGELLRLLELRIEELLRLLEPELRIDPLLRLELLRLLL